MPNRLVRALLALAALAALATPASAFDPAKAFRYPSPDLNTPSATSLSTGTILPLPETSAPSGGNRLSLNLFAPCASTSQETTNSSACANYRSPDGKTFAWNVGLTSDSSSPIGDKVALYTAFHGLVGGAGGWAQNILTTLERGSGGGFGVEIDYNNFDCDVGGPIAVGNCEKPKSGVGVLITGLRHNAAGIGGAGRAAIVVTTPQTKLWHHGFSFEGDAIIDSELFTNSSSERIFDLRGTHSFGLDLSRGTFNGSAINLKFGGTGQAIAWRDDANVSHFNVTADPNLNAMVFSPNAGGNTLFRADGSWVLAGNVSLTGISMNGVASGTLCVDAARGVFVKTTPGSCL